MSRSYVYGCQKNLKIPTRREPTDAEKAFFKESGRDDLLKPAPFTRENAPPIVLATEAGDTCLNSLMGEGPAELIFSENSVVPHCRCESTKHLHRIWLETDAEVGEGRYGMNGNTTRFVICQQVNHMRVQTDQPPIAMLDAAGGRAVKGVRINGRFNIVFDEANPLPPAYCPCGQPHAHRMWIETDAEVEVIE